MSKPSSRDALTLILSRRSRSRKDQQRVEERALAGNCLNKFLAAPGSSETVDCPRKSRSRGLCPACQAAFDRMTAGMAPQEAVEFEERQIEAGLMLREQEIREIKQRNVMRRAQ